MLGKKKGKKVKGAKKPAETVVNELQLRRDLRQQTKMTDSVEPAQAEVTPAPDEPKFSEDIRIGGIEG